MATQDVQYADTRDMVMAHDMFRREFGLMPGLVRGVADGDTKRAEVVAQHIDLLNTALTHHHHGEDTHLWPRLSQRAPLETHKIVSIMEGQHAAIEKADAELVEALAVWRGEAGWVSATALSQVLERLVALLREHLAVEEETALPLIEKYVTAAEWGAMVQAEGADMPPENMGLIFGLMSYEADPVLVEEILAGLPGDMGAMLKPLAAQAFADHSLRVHGTATPPRAKN